MALGIATTVLACALLQAAFSLFYWLPTRSLEMGLRPSVDAVVLIAFILAGTNVGRLRGRGRRIFISVVPIILGACVLLGVAQGIAKREFGYDFTLAYHMSKVHALFKMMYEAQSALVFAITMALFCGAIALLIGSGSWALRRLIEVAHRGPQFQRFLGIGLGAYTVIMGLALGMNGSMSVELAKQLDEVAHRDERLKQQAKKIEKKLRTVKTLQLGDDLRRPTVLIFVVESYGQVLMEAEKYAGYREVLAGLETSLRKGGYDIRSAVFEAPVFGGSSWLANASILCRVMVPTEKYYFSLMETQNPCLPKQFNDAGYHSIFAASNTTETSADYRTHFPFETFITKNDFGYKGPRMSWSYMPDQFLIDTVERRFLSQPSERPFFAYYKLTSSHHPWDTIPPFIKDWNKIGDGAIYFDREPLRYPDNAFLGGTHYNEGYDDAVRYSMKTIVAYLNSLPKERDVLAIILGDHQPRRPVANMDKDPWTVPLHVVSRDHELVGRFDRLDYIPGLLTKTGEGPVPGLDMLAAHLFRGLNDIEEVETTIEVETGAAE